MLGDTGISVRLVAPSSTPSPVPDASQHPLPHTGLYVGSLLVLALILLAVGVSLLLRTRDPRSAS